MELHWRWLSAERRSKSARTGCVALCRALTLTTLQATSPTQTLSTRYRAAAASSTATHPLNLSVHLTPFIYLQHLTPFIYSHTPPQSICSITLQKRLDIQKDSKDATCFLWYTLEQFDLDDVAMNNAALLLILLVREQKRELRRVAALHGCVLDKSHRL